MQAFFSIRAGGYLRYLVLDGGEPVRVFLHRLGSAATADYPAIATHPALAGRRSLLVDLLGFGFSDRPETFGYTTHDHAETLAELLDAQGIRQCELVGHSMGGTVAIALAARRPDLVGRLVVAEANLDPGGGFLSRKVAAQTEAEYVRRGHRALVKEVRRQARSSPSWAAYLGALQAAAPHAMYRTARSLVRGSVPTWRELLCGLAIPRVFVFGARNLPDPDTDRLTAAGVRVLVVPEAGHGMMDDNPDGFARAVAAALGAGAEGRSPTEGRPVREQQSAGEGLPAGHPGR